jgi:hypothetical protein
MIGSDDFPQLDSSDGAIVQHPGVSILAFRGMGKDNNYRRRDPVKFKKHGRIITLRPYALGRAVDLVIQIP